jgi:hypothetical protein
MAKRKSKQVRLKRQLMWLKPEEFAEFVDRTPRQLRNLEDKGMPVRRIGRGRRYPVPDALKWFGVYSRRLKQEKVGWLDLDEAAAEHTLHEIQWELKTRFSRVRAEYDADGHRVLHEDDVIPHFHDVLGLEDGEEIAWEDMTAEKVLGR